MPVWVFAALIPVALLACPLSMWVMGKVMPRKVSCAMCNVGTHGDHQNSLVDLEARRAAVEREIVQVKTDLVRHDANTKQATTKAEER